MEECRAEELKSRNRRTKGKRNGDYRNEMEGDLKEWA
jgi:hypothetical protein